MDYIDIKNIKIIIHFWWTRMDYFCIFIDTDYKLTKKNIFIHGTPVRVSPTQNFVSSLFFFFLNSVVGLLRTPELVLFLL